MSNFVLGGRSRERLKGVDDRLALVVNRAIVLTEVDFSVIEGIRSKERQIELVSSGASRTLNSKHLSGKAVDLGAYVGGRIRWDWPLYHKIASAMKAAAKELGVNIDCGADWRNFPDGPHFELI